MTFAFYFNLFIALLGIPLSLRTWRNGGSWREALARAEAAGTSSTWWKTLLGAVFLLAIAGLFLFTRVAKGAVAIKGWGIGVVFFLGFLRNASSVLESSHVLLADRWGMRIAAVGLLQNLLSVALADFFGVRDVRPLPAWLTVSGVVFVVSCVLSAAFFACAGIQKRRAISISPLTGD